jgi:hypothetical protein
MFLKVASQHIAPNISVLEKHNKNKNKKNLSIVLQLQMLTVATAIRLTTCPQRAASPPEQPSSPSLPRLLTKFFTNKTKLEILKKNPISMFFFFWFLFLFLFLACFFQKMKNKIYFFGENRDFKGFCFAIFRNKNN